MAIKAHLDPRSASNSNSASDIQRTATRRALRLDTSGFAPGSRGGSRGGSGPQTGDANVTIHNISSAGLLMETELDLAEGDELAIELPEAGAVSASVVWRSERLFGCAFDEVLSPAALAAAQLQGFVPGVPTQPIAPPAPASRGPAETLGTRLNRLRREAGLTLADVAATLGVSKPTVWAWEKGKARPLPERLESIAAALGVDPALLAPGPGVAREIDAVIADCRQRIAEACGTDPQAVRIMIEI